MESKLIKKLNYNDYDEAKEIVKRFIEDHLHGNIDELANFSFWDIEGTEYDGNQRGKFDGDRTRIVYAIDYLLYKDSNFPNFYLNKNYTGDTINSFRTLFGNRETNTEKDVENKFKFTDSEKQIKNEFFRTYQKLGNFYLLPTGKGTDGAQTINTYRGTERDYKDFFDVFLKNLNLCFLNCDGSDEKLHHLLKADANVTFFEKFSSIQKFCGIFYLDDYLGLDFNHPQTKNNVKCNYRGFESLGIKKDEYKKFAFGYVTKARELINKRSLRLVQELKEKYPELRK